MRKNNKFIEPEFKGKLTADKIPFEKIQHCWVILNEKVIEVERVDLKRKGYTPEDVYSTMTAGTLVLLDQLREKRDSLDKHSEAVVQVQRQINRLTSSDQLSFINKGTDPDMIPERVAGITIGYIKRPKS